MKNILRWLVLLLLIWNVKGDVWGQDECDDLTIEITPKNPKCHDTSDGEITIKVNPKFYSGTINNKPITFDNSTGEAIIDTLSAGDYEIIITNTTNIEMVTCTKKITLTAPDPLKIYDITPVIDCDSVNKQKIEFKISGGTPNDATKQYKYYWTKIDKTIGEGVDSGAKTITIWDLSEGSYNITVTDANECQDSTENIDIKLSPIELQIDTIDVKCHGDSTGSLTITPTLEGTNDFTYAWSPNADVTLNEATNLYAGDYTVTISTPNANDCPAIETINITQPDMALMSISITTPVSCHGDSDGKITLSPSGGTPDYTYLWSNQATGASIDNLSAKTYTVTITDKNNCTDITSIMLTEPPEIKIDQNNIQAVDCHGDNTGQATIYASGGTGNLKYRWSNNDTAMTADQLLAGNYTVTVTDEKDCSETLAIEITEPDALVATIAVSPIPCTPDEKGELTVTIQGGTPIYTTQWDLGQSGTTASYSTEGIYTVIITDANDCTISTDAELLQGSPPEITVFPTQIILEHETAQSIPYEVDFTTANLNWTILELNNIDPTTIAPSGVGSSTIDLVAALAEQRLGGSFILEVYPESNGCKGDPIQTQIYIYPDNKPVFVPEVFSPNEDGRNDTWEIQFSDAADNYSIMIFSRSGAKVYEANSLAEAWAGDGCPDGAYYYVIEDKETNNQYRGAVSILR